MKALYALCLSLAAFAFARPAQAELEYLVYDLSTKTTETVTNPDVTADEYHTGSEMLFVRDTTVADQTYYIGVFEVTRAQAATLKWTGVPENNHDGWAYGTNAEGNFATAVKPLPKNLAFPTHAQWVAYTDDPATLTNEAKKYINIKDGASSWQTYSSEEWYNDHLCASPSQLKPNSHGVYDIYGNVAEYATKGEGDGPFYGGAAADRFTQLSENSQENLRNNGKLASKYGKDSHSCGARLVYMPPKEQLYSVTVTLEEADVTETTVTVPEGADPAALAVGTSVTVTPPTPAAGKRLSGYTVTPDTLDFTEASNGTLTFTMPTSAVTIAYTSEPYGTITVEGGMAMVTHDEETISAENGTEVVQGDIVTLLTVESAAYERFTGWTVTKDGGEPTPIEPTTDEETQESVYAYEIPALDGGETFAFTAVFEKIPYATITVKNGHAEVNGETVTEVVNGQEVTLVANDSGAHQVFTGCWETPEDIEVTNNRFKVSGLTGQGEKLTFEAKIQTYPFVRVFGGTVSGTEGGRDDGEGYYYPGTTLNLTPSGLDGYKHDGWSVDVNGKMMTLQGNSYTIPANTYDVTIAITALYEAPTEPDQVEPGTGATIRLGYTGTENAYTAPELFGSEVAGETTLDDGYGNVYAFPGYTPAGTIATFDLTNGSISYGEPADDAGDPPSLVGYEGSYAEFWREYMAWWQKAYGTESTSYSNAALTLRRVTRTTDDPYDDFYLGVYETSIGNVAYLQKLCLPDAKDLAFLDGKIGDAKPYCFNLNVTGFNKENRDALFDAGFDVSKLPALVGKAFGVTVTVPSKSDLVAVAGTPPTDNPNAGRGASKDTEIKTGMVVHLNNNTVKTVHGMDPDPYGFYGIWGSRWEYIGGTVAVGGAWNTGWEQCHVDKVADGLNWSRPSGLTLDVAFRPKVAVEKPVTVTVKYRVGETDTEIGTVEVAPGKALFADFEKATPVRAGYTFLRWELDGTALTENPTLAAGTTTATLTAVWEESSVSVAFEYVDCMGPSVGYPGQLIFVYPPEGRQFEPNRVAIELSNRDVLESFVWPGYPDLGEDGKEHEDGSERFLLKKAFTVTKPVTITGTLVPIEEPEPEVKPGYRFRLR